MANKKYDESSIESIVEHARGLTGKSLADVVDLPKNVEEKNNKGNLGQLVENYYFEYAPNSYSGPDFSEVGLELKTTGVKKNSHGKFVAKERLVLTMIDYEVIVDESWTTSQFLKKCSHMLIMFYLYEPDVPAIERPFVIDPIHYELPAEDLAIIRGDWEKIKQKVMSGKAHELSEGDTFYLGACRKGSGGAKEALRKQPFSNIGAKARAFSFKPSYLNKIIERSTSSDVTLGVNKKVSLEQATANWFQPFIGLSVAEISSKLQFFKASANHKSFLPDLVRRMLQVDGHDISEIKNAGIEIKTIRLQENGKPKESMSFPGFRFDEIVKQSWEESSFFEKIERKFLFVVFRIESDGTERLERVAYWNMPYADREEARKVWEDTRSRVRRNITKFPGKTENRVSHVRPKGQNGNDLIPLPNGQLHLRQCFWLNNSYIADVVSGL